MRIAINALSVKSGGGLTFLRQLLKQLHIQGSTHQFIILATPERLESLVDDAPNVFKIGVSHRGLMERFLWEQFRLPSLLQRERIDVLLAPANIGPILVPVRFVVIVQNVYPLIRQLNGEPWPFRIKLKASRILLAQSIRLAKRVVAVSEYTRGLIVKECGINPSTVTVVPHGCPEDQQNADNFERVRLGLSQPYLLAVSDIRHNKNYPRLVEAFKWAAITEMELVIAGAPEHPKAVSDLRSAIRRHELNDRVRILGALSPSVLRSVYKGATAVVFPSLIESFGLPALEAMAYGIPVVASRIESIMEICGDAIVYCDPYDVSSIAEGIKEVLMNSPARQKRISTGLARAGRYSWTETARRILTILEDVSRN